MDSQSLPQPVIAVRSSTGVELTVCAPTQHCTLSTFPKDASPMCRTMDFSPDGKLFAWCNNLAVNVIELPSGKRILEIPKPKTAILKFSPVGNVLATWELYSAKESDQHLNCNLHLWDVKNGKCLHSWIQKKNSGWCPQWTDDEAICARNVNKEIHFFANNDFDAIVKKIHVQKVADFSISLGPSPFHAACYVPGISGQPSFVRLYRYPKFEGNNAIVASKSFFRADRVDMKWNKQGLGVLILTIADVDKTGASYYGEQKLHFLGTKGDSSSILLPKDGPVYAAEWNPKLPEFTVVYGFMPAKATIYNLKCEPIFDFGTGPRNLIYYNCFGSALILAGFGNLRGNVEVWDLKHRRLISKIEASDSTYLQWFSDGEQFITATTSPRLRVGNGYKLWNYTGKLLLTHNWETNQELYDVIWQPHSKAVFSEKKLNYSATSVQQQTTQPAQQAYRPPAARGRPCSFKIQEENELPSNLKAQGAELSKAALKNKKKKKAKANETVASENSENSTVDVEKEKKMRNLQKKLAQIESLKKQKESGKVLELNQLEKIQKEDELRQNLKDLQI